MQLKRITSIALPWALLSVAPAAWAQRWEFGGGVGGGFFTTSRTVTGGALSGSAGFAPGIAGSVYLAQSPYRLVSGEIRYTYQMHDLKLSSGGTDVRFAGRSQAIHYDFLLHATSGESAVRPFVAFGAGFKQFTGTGREVAAQPLGNLAFLTKTSEWKPLASVGGGIKFHTSGRVNFRIEVRDYITPFPKEVITPAAGAKVGGWLNNFVAFFGVAILL